MKLGHIDFPGRLINSLRDSRLVIFAGAGVSMGKPACLPNFRQLTKKISVGTGKLIKENEPEDHFHGKLQHSKVNVHARAAQALTSANSSPNELHRSLLRLYPDVEQIRIVTTNFDQLFEQAAEEFFTETPEIFRAPALPLGNDFTGIVHVHGSLVREHEMVLTDADFGRAYLTQGWARRFLVDVFRNFDVLFVGYSHNDVIINYLARAIPDSEPGRRFALTDCDDDLEHWNVLGIASITYPQQNKDDFGSLYDGVQLLSVLVNRNILDWKRELNDLASKSPPIDEEAIGLIEHALEVVERTRFFTETARLKDWIKWFDQRKVFDALFLSGDLSPRDIEIARWLAENYVVPCANDVFLLISNHGGQLNPLFWSAVAREVGLCKTEINSDTLSRWISQLLATIPLNSNVYELLWLGERCQKLGLFQNVLQVFDKMTQFRLDIKPGYSWSDDVSDKNQPLQIESRIITDHYALNEIWQKYLKPNLETMSEAILENAVNKLEKQYFTLVAWQKADRNGDYARWDRLAIEPHDQDEYSEAVDVLIDATRDSLEWLAVNQYATVSGWIERLISSEVPLLRRLAVHAIAVHSGMNADDKIKCLLARTGLEDYAAHHEIYRLFSLNYPNASTELRGVIIDSVLAYTCPDQKDPDREIREARYQFDWLDWLYMADPKCALVQTALDRIKTHYPDFQTSKYPDFMCWTEGGLDQPKRLWTAKQLLSKHASEWLPELLTFVSTELLIVDISELVSAIYNSAKQKLDWGIELANELVDAKEWNSSLWSGLLRAWSEIDLVESDQQAILDLLANDRLLSKFQYEIAYLLRYFVKGGNKQLACKFLFKTDSIANKLWLYFDHSEPSEEKQNWINAAINHPAGILAEYWSISISLWRKSQDPLPKTLDNEHRNVLNEIVSQQSLAGSLGKSVLASQFAFFLAVDYQWTLEKLQPLFGEPENIIDFQSTWDGFLTLSRLTPDVAATMEDSFLNAIKQLNTILRHRKKRFIEYFTVILAYYAKNPIQVWIPALFENDDTETRKFFTLNIKRQLHKMSEPQQKEWWDRWLKQYWKNRLQSVPAPLDDGEIETMLDWLPHLTSVFSEAIELAIQMPKAQLQQSLIIYQLTKSDLITTFPTESAKLVLYFGDLRTHSLFWHKSSEIFNALNNSQINSELKQQLAELKAKLGL